MEGGQSPDHQYQLMVTRVTDDRGPKGYDIQLLKSKRRRPVFTFPGNGYLVYSTALERCRALWHRSSEFFAFTESGARHSAKLYVYAIEEGKVRRLDLPDYVQNALGRVKAVEVDQACVTQLLRWEGDKLIVSLSFTANRRHSYTGEVTFRLRHGDSSAPAIDLEAISELTESEG